MNYNEFAQKIKAKYPEYNDMDNRELAQKMVAKYPKEYADVTFDDEALPEVQVNEDGSLREPLQAGVSKNVNLTPSGIVRGVSKNLAAGLFTPVTAMKENISIPEAFKKQKENMEKTEIENPDLFHHPVRDFVTDTAVYAALPEVRALQGFRGAGMLNKSLTGAYQGGLIGGLESLKNKGISKENVNDAAGLAAMGAVLPPALSGLGNGVRNLIASPGVQNRVTKTLEALTSVPKKYSDLALKRELEGKSLFKGAFDPETAYRPVEQKLREAKRFLPTSEDFAERFYNVGKKAKRGLENVKEKAGEDIRKVLNKFKPEDLEISGLKNEISELVNSFANGGEINPALIRAKKEIEQINRLLGNKSKEEINAELRDYIGNVRKASGLETTLDKEQEEIAFTILAQATGKNKNWLKSQLKANLPKMPTQKRQEFIENLLEYTDDKIENIDPSWVQKFPELTFSNTQEHNNGQKIATEMFDKIMGRNFRGNRLTTPEELAYNDAEVLYNKLLNEVVQNPSQTAYNKAFRDIENVVTNLDDYGKNLFMERLSADIDNIDNIVNKKIKPIDLHNIKEILYDIANYDNAGGIRNSATKALASEINEFLRKYSPEYAKANDRFALIKSVENDFGGSAGINANTIGGKLSKYGSDTNIISGMDKKLKDIDMLLKPQDRFLEDTKNLVKGKSNIDEINSLIGGSVYERNPKLLNNINDTAREEALAKLQKYSNINFMDDLEAIRAREALERFTPGQGGGSGSSQGYQNLLRSGVATTGSAAVGGLFGGPIGTLAGLGLGAAAVSPKIMGQGTIKNLGALYRSLDKEIPKWIYPVLFEGAAGMQ